MKKSTMFLVAIVCFIASCILTWLITKNSYGEMVKESIIVGGQIDYVYVNDGLPPLPPTGLNIEPVPLTAGEQQIRYENYQPSGDIRMKDGQGNWVEYDKYVPEHGNFYFDVKGDE